VASDLDVSVIMARLEPRFRRVFLEIVKRIQNDYEVERLVRLIETGRMHEFEAGLERYAVELGNQIVAGYTLSAKAASELVGVSFNGVNIRAVAEMQAMRHRVIRELVGSQIEAVRQTMNRGVSAGLNPVEIAREVRRSIGLTARQEQWVQNYRQLLEAGESDALRRQLRDRRFDRSVRRSTALTPDEIERMVQRYRERAIAYRARVIARTEALSAAHGGTYQMWNQAVSDGVIDSRLIVQRWVTSGLPNRRDSHITMHGQRRPFGVAFTSGAGVSLRYPGDLAAPLSETAQCACAFTVRIAPSIEVAQQMLAA
jgi:hypothetical protein